jgi:hypothetical protein
MPDGWWPSPVGAGGGTTPPFGHPSLKEGNVSGSLTSAGRRCILLRQPSPARRLSPPCPQAAPTRGSNHHALSESNVPSLPQTVSTQESEHHGEPESNAPSLSQAVSAQEPEHHGEPERNAPSLSQTVPVLRHSPPLRRGGRRPGWSARGGRQASADIARMYIGRRQEDGKCFASVSQVFASVWQVKVLAWTCQSLAWTCEGLAKVLRKSCERRSAPPPLRAACL